MGIKKIEGGAVMGKVCVLGLVVLLSATGGAYADITQFGLNFNGAGDSATASLTASGSATVGGSGTYYSWVGWPVSSWASVTISFTNQTVGIGTNPDTININKDPTGTGLVSFEDAWGGYGTIMPLDSGSLDDLDVALLGGSPQGLALDRITLTGDVGGLVDVEVRLDASGSITQLDYDMTSGLTIGPDGQYVTPPAGQASYTVIPVGDVDAAYSASIDGELEVMGLFTIDLGTIASFTGLESLTGLPLPGTMTLTETDGDVDVHIHSGFESSLEVPFTTAGAESVNTYAGNKNPYYKVNFNYDFAGDLVVGSVAVDLYDTLVDAVPEPVTIAVFGLGGVLLGLCRRRGRK
jgi:hypothetical protein